MEEKKIFYILQGCPGAGKSTYVEKHNLQPYTVSTDEIRLEISGISKDKNGNDTINQANNGKVFEIVWGKVEELMYSKCSIVVLDATNCSNKSFEKIHELSEKWGYAVCIIRFKVEREELFERNKHRGFKNVPAGCVGRMYKSLSEFVVPEWCELRFSTENIF